MRFFSANDSLGLVKMVEYLLWEVKGIARSGHED
jgi:hypothetical protein